MCIFFHPAFFLFNMSTLLHFIIQSQLCFSTVSSKSHSSLLQICPSIIQRNTEHSNSFVFKDCSTQKTDRLMFWKWFFHVFQCQLESIRQELFILDWFKWTGSQGNYFLSFYDSIHLMKNKSIYSIVLLSHSWNWIPDNSCLVGWTIQISTGFMESSLENGSIIFWTGETVVLLAHWV